MFFVFLKLPDTPTDRRSKDIESARSDRESKEDIPATPEPRTPLYLGRSVFEAATFQVKSTGQHSWALRRLVPFRRWQAGIIMLFSVFFLAATSTMVSHLGSLAVNNAVMHEINRAVGHGALQFFGMVMAPVAVTACRCCCCSFQSHRHVRPENAIASTMIHTWYLVLGTAVLL